MNWLKRIVFFAGLTLFLLWFWPNQEMLTGDQDGFLRLVLGGFFALAILLRIKPRRSIDLGGAAIITGAGVLGAALTVLGLIFRLYQFEWLGIILVLFACLRWSLPDRWSADIVRSLFLLYWIHPLPGRLGGWFEILMQKFSIWGSEWLLHIFNVRVWAEGIYIRTGHNVFGVPEECSGMRTSVTMLICVVGVSILMRQRWWETLLFMVLGIIQVLFLNIVRIAFMIAWAPRMPPDWGTTFLHDSLGAFLLIAIFLIQLEMSWWKVWRNKADKLKALREEGTVEAPDKATILPPFWNMMSKYFKWGFLVVMVVLAFSYAQYKRRPAHRAAMISDVIDGLIDKDTAAAEAAVNDALSYLPQNRALLVKKAHILLLRKKYEQVVEVTDGFSPPLDAFETVLKSWALMSLNRPKEAIGLIEGLPLSSREMPGVAIVRAEYAAQVGEVINVSSNVLIASQSSMTVERVRSLYPFLAKYEQWPVIAESNHASVPVPDVGTALIIMQSYLKTDKLIIASQVLEKALEKWPDDERLLNALYFMALKRPGQKWEEFFVKNFTANVNNFTADATALRMDMAFRLGRADLGWLAFRRLESLDPTDPALFFAVARYGSRWFVFRREQIGVRILNGKQVIDLAPFVAVSSSCALFHGYWDKVPYAEELSAVNREIFQAKCLDRAVNEYRLRIADGSATPRMEGSYPKALGLAGRYAEAHAFIDRMAEKYPDRKTDVLLEHAELYHAEKRWQESYEQLRLYMQKHERPGISARLMMVDDLVNMNLGVYALDVIRTAAVEFPGAQELKYAEAVLWSIFGFNEQALHLLGDEKETQAIPMRRNLLFETGRYQEAKRLSVVLGLPKPDLRGARQKIVLTPADVIMKNSWPAPFTQTEIKERLIMIEKAQVQTLSPFLGDLLKLEHDFFRGTNISVKAWADAGRDSQEKAVALHRLVVLAGRQEMPELAREAAVKALDFMPWSSVLWRILIALDEGKAETVDLARQQCPDDPEIWLASVVSTARASIGKDEMKSLVSKALEGDLYPGGTLVRAGDYLLSKGDYVESACLIAQASGEKCRGLLAADMLSLRCALIRKDFKWAVASCLKGIENALDPTPFYKMMVALKSAGRQADGELVQALEHLYGAYPAEERWAENLGMVYFERGDMARSWSVLNALIKKDSRKVTVRSFILAAEAARIEGYQDRAVEILRYAYNLNAESETLLNNLVYNLAQDPATLQEAVDLLPQLEKIEDRNFDVLDTIAVVHMKSGRLEEAWKYMEQAVEAVDANAYSAREVMLNSAELMIRLGRTNEAEKVLLQIRRDVKRTDMIDTKARRLLDHISTQGNGPLR